MHYFYVLLEGFYLRGVAGIRVLHDGAVVLDATEEVQGQGVLPGCGLREAKAILQGASFERHDPEAYRKRQKKWLDVCAKYSDVIEPDGQHAAWIDMSAHASPADLAVCLADDLFRTAGVRARIGMSPVKWIAALATLHCDPYTLVGFEPIKDAAAYIAPLPVSLLSCVPTAHRERLRALGYRTIGQARQATLRALRNQFGDDGYRLYHALRGESIDSVQALYPERSLSLRLQIESGDELDVVVDALRCLAGDLAVRLSDSDVVGHEVRLYIQTEDSRIHTLSRKSAKPLQTASAIAFVFELLFEKMHIVDSVIQVRAVLPELKSAKRKQSSFELLSSSVEKRKRAEDALRVICAAHGNHAVERATDLIEPRRKKLLRAWRAGFEF